MPIGEPVRTMPAPRGVHWGAIRKAIVYSRGTTRSTGMCFNYTLRFLTGDDIDKLCDLQAAVLATLPRPLPIYERDHDFFAACVTDRGCVVGAFDNNNLIGYATLFVPSVYDTNYGADLGLPPAELPSVAHLAGSATHPLYRGNGLQSRLVAMRGTFARHAGFQHLCGEVVPYNAVSMENHFANGYFLKSFRIDQFRLPNFILHKDLRFTPTRLGDGPFPEAPVDDVYAYRRMLEQGFWGFRITRRSGKPHLGFARFRQPRPAAPGGASG